MRRIYLNAELPVFDRKFRQITVLVRHFNEGTSGEQVLLHRCSAAGRRFPSRCLGSTRWFCPSLLPECNLLAPGECTSLLAARTTVLGKDFVDGLVPGAVSKNQGMTLVDG